MSSFAKDSTLVLADLGSAVKLASADDTSRFQIGTPGYLAPEVLLGQAYGLSCDIWSIGALMTVLLSANIPFWDDDRKVRKNRVCTEPLNLEQDRFMARLSESGKNLVSGMLIKDPS